MAVENTIEIVFSFLLNDHFRKEYKKIFQKFECMLFMFVLLVSSHLNRFCRGWIIFLQTEGVEPGEKFKAAAPPLPR